MPREVKVVNKTVKFSNEIGKIKPMHAVNNGPKQWITLSWDISPYYREMNIPYSRLGESIDHTDRPLSSYWSFVNFGKLYKLGKEVDSGEFDVESTLYVCAAKNKNEGGIFIVKPDDEDFNVKIKIENANYKKMRIYVMNQREWTEKMTLIEERDFENEITLNFAARQRYSMAYIELI